MDYKNYNDYELLYLIREDDEEALNILLKKYTPLVFEISNSFFSKCGYIGASLDDLIEEGYLGIYKAILHYKSNKNVKFYTFAKICIETKIYNFIRHSKKASMNIMNNYISFENVENYYEKAINDSDNYSAMIDNNVELDYHRLALDTLTPFEFQVYELKLAGLEYNEIGIFLEKSRKSIDNTLQRIRRKLKKHFII